MTLSVGDSAPAFSLPDQDKQSVSLADLRGTPVLLVFSTDPVFSLKAFREKESFDFPLLSDFWPHGATAQAYGVFNEKAGMALRGTFLIDAEGKIAFAEVNSPGDAREQSGWKDAVGKLAA